MKTKLKLSLILGLAFTIPVHADLYFSAPQNYVSSPKMMKGGLVGNGGGTVVCRVKNRKIKSIELLDFYEAREERHFKLDIMSLPGDWKAKVSAILTRLRDKSELRYQLYSDWLNRFESERMFRDAKFSTVADSMPIGIPNGCEYEQAAVQRKPIFTGDARYYLNTELWNAMDESQKAGLVLHEIIYREAIGYGHTDSIRSRYLTGLYASEKFAQQDIKDYWKALSQAHYELTDVTAPDEIKGTVVTQFLTSRIWQVAPDEQKVPETIELNGRFLVKVGDCDQGCQNYESSLQFEGLYNGSRYFYVTLAKDIQSLKIGHTLVLNKAVRIYSGEDRPIPPESLLSLNHAELALGSDSTSSTLSISAPSDNAFEVVEEKGANSHRQAMGATALTLTKDRTGKVWRWQQLAAEQIFSDQIPISNASYILRGLAVAKDPCIAASVSYENDIPLVVTNSVYQTEKCRTISPFAYSLVYNNFSNGSAATMLDARTTTSIEYNPKIPNVFMESSRAYTAWSAGPSSVRCKDGRDAKNCLLPIFDSNGIVSKIKVSEQMPTLNTFEIIATVEDGPPSKDRPPYERIDPRPDSFQMFGVLIQDHSDINLYSDGMVKNFVTGQELKGNFKGQVVSIPVGTIVELDQKGYLNGFHP